MWSLVAKPTTRLRIVSSVRHRCYRYHQSLGGGEVAGRSPVDRGKQGLKRSGMVDGYGIPLGRVLAGVRVLV